MRVYRKSYNELNLKSVPQQTNLWSEVKRRQGYNTHVFQIAAPSKLVHRYSGSNYVSDDVLIIEQFLDEDTSIAYVPYGPVLEPDDDLQGTFLEELSEALRPKLNEQCCLIKYDLKWESPWAKDDDLYENNKWIGPPSSENQEIRLNFNTLHHNLRKSPSDNLPVHTIFLDLTSSEEDLLMQMKPKTRYNIRLALRKGVKVKSYGIEKFCTCFILLYYV